MMSLRPHQDQPHQFINCCVKCFSEQMASLKQFWGVGILISEKKNYNLNKISPIDTSIDQILADQTFVEQKFSKKNINRIWYQMIELIAIQ